MKREWGYTVGICVGPQVEVKHKTLEAFLFLSLKFLLVTHGDSEYRVCGEVDVFGLLRMLA
jgi:hypothetical protein